MRESVPAKATRLLVTGAVCIVQADGLTVSAVVQGDTGAWDVEYEDGHWACSCPAYKPCSHIRAVELVATPAREAVAA